MGWDEMRSIEIRISSLNARQKLPRKKVISHIEIRNIKINKSK